jgi:hypothetical protein
MKAFQISNETATNSNHENALAAIRVELQDMANEERETIAIVCDEKVVEMLSPRDYASATDANGRRWYRRIA